MNNIIVFDAHCDTISKILDAGQELHQNKGHLDLSRVKKYKGYIQFFAAFIDPQYVPSHSLKRSLQIMDKLFLQVEKNREDIAVVTNYTQAMEAIEQQKIAAFLTVEGGEALQGDLGVLRMLYRIGVRSICLTWNGRNEIADGVGEERSKGGLTAFGLEVVKEMNRLGMLIDVSHLSENGFWDVMANSTQPVIASHSNAEAMCSHVRNLTGEQFQAIMKSGGVVGINLNPPFLNETGKAGIADIIRHIEYFMALGGENHIGLGSDWDGIEDTPYDIKGVEDVGSIFDALLRLNYTQEQVDKIAGKNFMNLIQRIF